MSIELTTETLQVFLAKALEHASPFGAEEETRTLNNLLGREELYQLSYFRNLWLLLWVSFRHFYVKGVIKPTNITGVGFYVKPSPQKRQFLSSLNWKTAWCLVTPILSVCYIFSQAELYLSHSRTDDGARTHNLDDISVLLTPIELHRYNLFFSSVNLTFIVFINKSFYLWMC